MERRGQAWTVSHLLVAAGCDPSKVTPAQLLGEKVRTRRGRPPAAGQPSIEEVWRWMQGGKE